jgi:hypothetical protein
MTSTGQPDLLEVIAAFFAAEREAGQVHLSLSDQLTPEPEPEIEAEI